MKQNISWYLVLLLSIVFVACQNEAKVNDFDETALDIPKSEEATLKYIADVEAFKDTMQQRGPLTVVRDSTSIEVTGYFDGDNAMLILAEFSQTQLWHYFQGDNVVLLKEIKSDTFGRDTYTENQFFYNATQLLGQRTRIAPSLDSLSNSPFTPMTIDSTDMRAKPTEVTGAAFGYMYGY